MISAVAVLGQVVRSLAFEVDAGQIVEHQTHRLRKSPLIKLLLEMYPMAVELIHGQIDVIFVEGFIGFKTASLGQPGAFGFLSQRQFGAGKKQTAIDHCLEQAALTR